VISKRAVILSNCFILSLFASFLAFADDEPLSTFNTSGDINYQEYLAEEDYLAARAPMESSTSWYFGADFGPNITSLTTKATYGSGGNPRYTVDSKQKQIVSYGVTGFLGFGGNINHLYLGSELSGFYNFLNKNIHTEANTSSTSTATDIAVQIQQPITLGLDFIPGYLTDSRNFLIYGRIGLGVNWSKLLATSITNTSISTDKTNKFVFGIRLGAGIEYFITDNFGIRFEYVYVGYKKVNGDTYNDSSGTNTYSYSLSGTGLHQAKLGLLIHF
jgi:opacity protein-like surface antigen